MKHSLDQISNIYCGSVTLSSLENLSCAKGEKAPISFFPGEEIVLTGRVFEIRTARIPQGFKVLEVEGTLRGLGYSTLTKQDVDGKMHPDTAAWYADAKTGAEAICRVIGRTLIVTEPREIEVNKFIDNLIALDEDGSRVRIKARQFGFILKPEVTKE